MADKQYIFERDRRNKISKATGIALTVAVHAGLVACCFFAGLSPGGFICQIAIDGGCQTKTPGHG